ncbi:MAG TPA: diacylglycerol kinase family lipid kinase [Pyrinomonadaceae bacterium]|nr:diacylglycerol kinase family lipid kinase [Pyrinomonadaceae bacterium]HMP65989.1 diacylglycerol kinase family lipid kinase [Pyrinomonadaceae bacterium]
MLPIVIVNPKSAAGSTRDKWSGVAADLRAHFGAFRVAFTKGPGDGIELARRHAEEGSEFIIACGGDGTINEVANGILASGSDAELGIFPSGTGGDLRRTIGLPTTPREIARALRNGETRRIDVGKVSFIGNDGLPAERYFLNVSSFGLAASIIERVKGTTSLDWLPLDTVRGRASFALSTLQEVVGIGATRVRVKIDDGEETPLETVNFCVANARYFGGGMMIAPEAKLADGLLDVVNIGDIKTAKIILNAYTLYRGTHLDLPEVKSKLARRIEARPFNDSDIVHIEMDGELPGRLPAVYEVVPGALRLRVPAVA